MKLKKKAEQRIVCVEKTSGSDHWTGLFLFLFLMQGFTAQGHTGTQGVA